MTRFFSDTAVFANSERTALKYTVGGALASADRVLAQKRSRYQVCIDAAPRKIATRR